MSTKPDVWEDLPVENIENRLSILQHAELDASQNIPNQNTSRLSDTESNIKKEVEKHWRKENARRKSYFDKLEDEFVEIKQLLRADGHDVQIDNLQSDCGFLMDELVAEIKKYGDNLMSRRQDLNVFKRMNQLVRAPVVKSWAATFFSILLIVFMFVFETAANSAQLSNAVPGGLVGAASAAVVVSFINIVCSFLLGSMSLPQLNHVEKAKRTSAKVAIAIYIPIIFYMNFTLGVFRSLSEATKLNFSVDASQIAANQAAWPFDNLDDLGFLSIGLIVTGLIFALVSLIDGYHFNDKYPGYGDIGRKYRKARDFWDQETVMSKVKLDESRISDGIKLSDKRDARLKANLEWQKNSDLLQREFKGYDIWTNKLTEDGRHLMTLYRSQNGALRRLPAPDYFDENANFNLDHNASELHESLQFELVDDEEKERRAKEHESIIMGEYATSAVAMNKYYALRLTELNAAIQKYHTT